jgi:S-adenosylmethionine decarboxylase
MRTNTLKCPSLVNNTNLLDESSKNTLGKHFTLEFYNCEKNQVLNLENIFLNTINYLNFPIKTKAFNYITQNGINGFIATDEASFSMHAWPEYNYVTVDVFVFLDFININTIVMKLEHALKSQKAIIGDKPKAEIISSNRIKNDLQKNIRGNIDWEKTFKKTKAWGLSSSIDIYNCDPDLIRNADAIKYFVHELCDLIKMKRFGECNVVYFGEDEKVAGFSMTQFIETSLISGHFANETNTAYLDVFSCKSYKPEIVSNFAKEFFNGTKAELQITIRQ